MKKKKYGAGKMRRLVSTMLVGAMLFSISFPVTAADLTGFTDIPDSWSKAAINAAISNGLLKGDGNKILPDANLKRAEMAAIVNRAFGAIQKGDISKFSDITAGKWYVDDMAKAVKMGTFKGEGTVMRPDDPITRQEAFSVLARAFNLETNDFTSLKNFKDKAQISDWAKSGIAALAAVGYVNGNDGNLNPKSNISRAEFAQVIYNILKIYINKAGTYTNVDEGNVMVNTPDVILKGITIKGDLIIGDGVGTGNVTLDAVKITGRTLVRGGGKNSIHVINGSTIVGSVVIDNVNNEVRIVTDQGTTVQKIDAGSKVVLEGNFGEVKVIGTAEGNTGVEVKGNVQSLKVETKADVIITSGTVATIDIAKTAGGTNIDAAQGAKVETVIANAQTNVTGQGTVTNVDAKANDVKVETPGTNVTADTNVTGVTAGGSPVNGGSTAVVSPTAPATGNSTGGGGDGSSSSSNANLSGITLSTGTLYPEFAYSKTIYYVNVPSSIGTITVTPTVAESHATVKVNEASAATPVTLANGLNTVSVVVTAQNGGTKTYEIRVMRADPVSISDNTAFSGSEYTGICNNSYVIGAAGTYGPASGTATVTGSVYIEYPNVTLQNMTIIGNLNFGKEIGLGEAAINNVTVLGNTTVNGGGSHSIHIQGDSDLGIVEVNDRRDNPSEPINISAEGTGSIEAVNVTSQSQVKVTPVTDTIGFVAATDGSTVTYGGTESEKAALLAKIYAQANSILDAAITGTTDEDKETNPNLPNLTTGIVDISQYGIWGLKYYINPLDGVAAYASQYEALEAKLIAKGLDTDLIYLREHPQEFTADMFDFQAPDLGFNQGAINGWWNTYTRYLALKDYQVDSVGNVTAAAGNSDSSESQAAFIGTAETLYGVLKTLQNSSVVTGVVGVDADSNGLDAGDRLEITFKRLLAPGDSSQGEDAVADLVYSDTTMFGSGAGVAWSTTPIDFYGSSFPVSKCTITLGTGAHTGLIGGTFTIPKNVLGSYIPNDFVEVHGQYGEYITDLQPLFDVDIQLPPQLYTPATPTVVGSVYAYDENHNSIFNAPDTIVFTFNCTVNTNTLSNWFNSEAGNIFGDQGQGQRLISYPSNNPYGDGTMVEIRLGSNSTIHLGDTFTIAGPLSSLGGGTPATNLQITLPGTFSVVQ